MYTIVMDNNKNLTTTVRTSLFQKESMVDKIQFLLPPKYGDNELKDYIVTMKYVDPNGNFHSEVLTLDDELYKEYLRYELPVTTKLTQVSGTITLRLTLIKFSQGTNTGDSEHSFDGDTLVINDGDPEPSPDPTTNVIDKLETESTSLIIQRPNGFTDYVNFEDIEAFKAKINELSSHMPNDVAVDDESTLHLTHNGEPMGEGTPIVTP